MRRSENHLKFQNFFERFECSGLSIRDFCNKENLSTKTFYYRKKSLKKLSRQSQCKFQTNDLEMIPVSVPVTRPLGFNSNYKIHFVDGTEITIPERFNPVMAGELIRLCRTK